MLHVQGQLCYEAAAKQHLHLVWLTSLLLLFSLYTVLVFQAAQMVLISLFELNTPEFTMLLGALPKTFQDGATKLLHNHLKNSSNAAAMVYQHYDLAIESTINRSRSGSTVKDLGLWVATVGSWARHLTPRARLYPHRPRIEVGKKINYKPTNHWQNCKY